jgi:hypothetical protein
MIYYYLLKYNELHPMYIKHWWNLLNLH